MPDERDDFDAAWAEIVADLTSGPPPEAHDDEQGAPRGLVPPEPPAPPPEPRPRPEPPAPDTGDPANSGLEALFEPLRRRRPAPEPAPEPTPDDFLDGWEDEGHFVPPPPPEIPEGTPIKRLAWAGVIGGPLIVILIAFTGWNPPGIVGIGAGLVTLAGFVTLVWHLPEGREDGWDDGARL